MKLHTITGVEPLDSGRLNLGFDDGTVVLVDLSPMLAQGGVFEPLRDPNRFAAVEIGPRGRTLVWHVGENVVDLCADALWFMAHPDVARSAATNPLPPPYAARTSTRTEQAAVVNTRPGRPIATLTDDLGPLADLAGTWVGSGFNLISLPDFDSRFPSTGPTPFRLKLNATLETLQFTPIGGPVPNRGSITAFGSTNGQPDIALHGLTYLQRVSDAVTKEALHIESGIWINVPATTVAPVAPPTVVRLSTIQHGDALMAQGAAFSVPGGPLIGTASSTPTQNPPKSTPISETYFEPFQNPPLPPGIQLPAVRNPNVVLEAAILGQYIINTVVLVISTNTVNVTTPLNATPPSTTIDIPAPSGNIGNIPFVVRNANATRLDAIFWIETVQQPDGSTFLQLQYTQTVILNFLGIDWPHISVATLTKQ